MRSDRVRSNTARAAVAAGVLLLAAACSGGGAAHSAVPPHRAANAAAAVPAPVTIAGTLNTTTASTVYEAAIVPAYPLAMQLAGALALHPAGSAAAVANFTSRLAKALASFGAVTAFPPQAEPSFAAYRSQARDVLVALGRPAAVVASVQSRRQAALELYAFARQIGVLGTDLNLVPATEQGGKH
jgi:hypothetical protein